MYSLKWLPEAWAEYVELQGYDRKALKKANDLIKDIQRNGYNGILGKSEMLKHNLAGYASVRLDKKNRIIFKIDGDSVVIVQCGGHYDD